MFEVQYGRENENEKAPVKGKAKFEKGKVRLTARDVGIIEFINDMKFASAKEIREKFFSGPANKSELSEVVAKNRLNLLKYGGYPQSLTGDLFVQNYSRSSAGKGWRLNGAQRTTNSERSRRLAQSKSVFCAQVCI